MQELYLLQLFQSLEFEASWEENDHMIFVLCDVGGFGSVADRFWEKIRACSGRSCGE